jgi:hypothetical protein
MTISSLVARRARLLRGPTRGLVGLAAVAICLVGAAPASADTDGFGNSLSFDAGCNPSSITLDIPSGANAPAEFTHAVSWVDYDGIPFVVSPPFSPYEYASGKLGAFVNIPSPSSLPGGQYTWHVLLQGAGESNPLLYFLFSTVADTASVISSEPYHCVILTARDSGSPVPKRAAAAPRRNLHQLTHASRRWFRRPGGDSFRGPSYPRARICRQSVCVQLRPHGAWQRIGK